MNLRDDLSREQIEHIESEIEKLRHGHHDMFRRSYREFFAHAKDIGQLFKQSKAIPHVERQRLWDSFSSLCDGVRREQERERESLTNNSRIKREVIEADISEAYHWAKGADSISELREAERRLTQITQKMKDGWSGFTGTTEFFESLSGNPGILTRQDRDCLWEKWREAKDAARERRVLLSDQHYQHMRTIASDCLEVARSNPREAKERIKRANVEMKQGPLNSSQYSEVRQMLDEAWETASRRAAERHEEWRSRMEGHIERWTELLEKNEEIITRLEEQIEECEEMESNARTEGFAATVREWIEEKLDKIAAIRHTNEELEERIESVKNKLTE